ncbi:MAG: type II secretion system protein GspI [Deltaproteobacteria bacterium RIFOXYD12_FULL_55_16]|nr:MAG: type II secretion system protein GspI [Deltaproteobacteria bacterium RIFOXYD12_FULL_55_16]
MSNSPRFAKNGFTLIEILIALAVLSIVAISAVKASGNAINNIYYLKQQTFAHWVAMNKAAELELAPQSLEQEKKEGLAMMADKPWGWAIMAHETSETGLRRVEILVWAEKRQGEPAARLTMFRRR